MSFINITTNNLSRRLRNSTTYVDNWVFVPGISITGDWRKPLLFTSLDEFKATCGDHGIEGSLTFDYVCGLLSAGLPVIFRRIAHKNQNSYNEQTTTPNILDAKQASYVYEFIPEGETDAVPQLTFKEKWGGSYGNDLYITTKDTGSAYYIEVYYKDNLIESHKICSYKAGDSVNEKLINALKSKEFKDNLERITITVENREVETFHFPILTKQQLSGGADFKHSSVEAEDIIGTMKTTTEQTDTYISNIADKALYQPKFITSGGYQDLDLANNASDTIAQAMLDLTKVRQDCRALIDINTGLTEKQVQAQADAISYTQASSTEKIPSGSMCAPWVYMQVGSKQLWMPPSYAYLIVVADDLSKGGHVYTPKAGISNGQISNVIRTEYDIGTSIIDKWQSDTEVNVNPITKLQGGRHIIAGNSTLLKPSTTGDENVFLESSADLTVIEIRRYVYSVASQLQYEYNSTDTFETFAIKVGDFLNRMVTEGAVTDYSIANVSTNDDLRTLKIRLDVYLTPTVKAIEIYLNIAYGEIVVGGEE